MSTIIEVKIIGTKEYDNFKSPQSNRDIDERHVRRLIKAIKRRNLLHMRPMIVNSKWEIIDGQHRLEAARKLGTHIFYIMSNEITKSDMATLNSFQKNWKALDYINYYYVEKHRGFDVLSKFMNRNPELTTSICLQLLHPNHTRNSNALRDGDIDVSNEAKAYEITKNLKDIARHFTDAYSREFIYALRRSIEFKQYDHDVFINKIKDPGQTILAPRCTKKEYLSTLARHAS